MVLSRYLNPVDKNLAVIRNMDIEFPNQLNFKGFYLEKNYAKIEEQNITSIRVFVYKRKIHTIFIPQRKLLKTMFIYY